MREREECMPPNNKAGSLVVSEEKCIRFEIWQTLVLSRPWTIVCHHQLPPCMVATKQRNYLTQNVNLLSSIHNTHRHAHSTIT